MRLIDDIFYYEGLNANQKILTSAIGLKLRMDF